MASKEIVLDEVITDIAVGPFGSNLKISCFVKEGFPIIDGANLKGFKVTDNLTKFVTEEKARSLSRSIAKRGDVVVTISGTLGQIAYVPDSSAYSEYLCSQRQFRVSFDRSKVYVPYLVYYFHTKEGQSKIHAFANQTGVPALSQPTKNFRSIRIELPSLDEQRRIARIGELLNDKIELNQQTNAYLEALGSTLVERYVACCADTILLKELLDLGGGFAFKSRTYVDNGKYKVLTIKNVQDGNVDCSAANRIDEIPGRMKEFCRLGVGDVVLSLTGNVGRVGIVSEPDCLLNQRVAVFLPSVEQSLGGLYFWFRQDTFKDRMIGIARGTAQANLSPVETLQLEIPFNKDGFTELCAEARPLFDAILANKKEMILLASLRDALLPKLMSGEIDVSQIELLTPPNSRFLQSGHSVIRE